MNNMLITALNLRKSIGISAILLPVVLLVMAGPQDSFSAYYWTSQRDTLVGTLAVIGAFLMAYNGYDKRDMVTAKIAGVAAMFVAWFPTSPPGAAKFGVEWWTGAVHGSSALIFFGALAYFCLRLFPLTAGGMTPEKIKRNRIFKGAGYVLLGAIAVSIAGVAMGDDSGPIVFWAETAGVWAFGWAWATKGEMILADSKD